MITVMMTMMGHGAHPTEGVGGTGRQPLNPATGRDRAAGQSPVGLTFRYKAARPMPPTMRRTCAAKTSPKTSVFGGVPNTGQHPQHCQHHAGDAKQGAEGEMQGNRSDWK